MPKTPWSAKRERQYAHIKESVKSRGGSTRTATRIAAATVNKERVRAGEAETTHGQPIRRRTRHGGRDHPAAVDGRTREQLYREAARQGVKGRARMNKAELLRAISHKGSA